MSEGMVTNAKRELVERGLITIDPGDAKTSTSDTITIVDIWQKNFAMFATPGHVVTTPRHDMTTPGHTVTEPGHTVTTPGHVVTKRNNPIKKEPIKKEPVKKGGRKRATDPTTTHPAVMAYRETFKCNLSKAQAAMVVEADVDLADWVRAIRAWLGRGYSPKNVTGMLEWARNPGLSERQNGSGNGHRPISKVATSMAESDRLIAMLKGEAK